jgi:hypothetical protein
MGVNNEYAYDAFQAEDARDDDNNDDDELVLDPQAWQDWNSEHILNMWMSLQAYLGDNHISNSILNRATFPKFVEFVSRNSS